MRKPRDRVVLENERDTAERHASGYVTERERRFAREIKSRIAVGLAVTPAQMDASLNIAAVMRRRGESL